MARPNFEEKTFVGGSKTAKFVNVFSLESFPLYGIIHAGICTVLLWYTYMYIDGYNVHVNVHVHVHVCSRSYTLWETVKLIVSRLIYDSLTTTNQYLIKNVHRCVRVQWAPAGTWKVSPLFQKFASKTKLLSLALPFPHFTYDIGQRWHSRPHINRQKIVP